MPKHEEKYCPRCHIPFECKVGSVLLCQCTTVALNNEERDFILSKYNDCLCAKCMKELKAAYHEELFQNKLKRILGILYKESKK